MIVTISPSKKQNFNAIDCANYTIPEYLQQSMHLIEKLRTLTPDNIAKLMKISNQLAELNYTRYRDFVMPFTKDNAKQAIFAFKGDVYSGIDVDSFDDVDLQFSQDNVRILSGLYGVLKPLDLIQPYRLEMGCSLKNKFGNNLYHFWQDLIGKNLDKENSIIVNLASNEYFKAVNPKKINAKILHIDFKEYRNNQFKTIGIFAKKARGRMVNFIVKNKIRHYEALRQFNDNGYQFNATLSNRDKWVFSR